jgi:hypothetical protein
MAIFSDNFSEKGEFETQTEAKTSSGAGFGDKTALNLPIKSKYSGSRTSSGSARSLRTAVKMPERDPLSKAVDFFFKFRGFQVEYTLIDTIYRKIIF